MHEKYNAPSFSRENAHFVNHNISRPPLAEVWAAVAYVAHIQISENNLEYFELYFVLFVLFIRKIIHKENNGIHII